MATLKGAIASRDGKPKKKKKLIRKYMPTGFLARITTSVKEIIKDIIHG